jgi:hypothetical protein
MTNDSGLAPSGAHAHRRAKFFLLAPSSASVAVSETGGAAIEPPVLFSADVPPMSQNVLSQLTPILLAFPTLNARSPLFAGITRNLTLVP